MQKKSWKHWHKICFFSTRFIEHRKIHNALFVVSPIFVVSLLWLLALETVIASVMSYWCCGWSRANARKTMSAAKQRNVNLQRKIKWRDKKNYSKEKLAAWRWSTTATTNPPKKPRGDDTKTNKYTATVQFSSRRYHSSVSLGTHDELLEHKRKVISMLAQIYCDCMAAERKKCEIRTTAERNLRAHTRHLVSLCLTHDNQEKCLRSRVCVSVFFSCAIK